MTNPVIILVVFFTTILLYFNLKPAQENFLGPIIKPLKALGDFVTNFPVIFGVLVDALLNFVLNFVDIMLSLVDVIMWIINVPMWAINGFMFILTGISDIFTLGVLWLNPVTMIKGIIKLVIFMAKLLFMTIISIIGSIGRTIGEKIFDHLRNGLWGVPHMPEQHLLHKDGVLLNLNTSAPSISGDLIRGESKRFARYQYGLYGHHHDHNDDIYDKDQEIHALSTPAGSLEPPKEIPMYHGMRCYKGMGANNYLNIVAIILCPPLGVFMSYGLQGILKILICAGLSLLYYFPGLIYALLITTHLGIGKEIDSTDCGGSFGGLIIEGCPKRLTRNECEEATIPNKTDKKGGPLKACIWTPDDETADSEIQEYEGICNNVHLRYDDYDKLKLTQPNEKEENAIGLTNEEVTDPSNKFDITGNTRKEFATFLFNPLKDGALELGLDKVAKSGVDLVESGVDLVASDVDLVESEIAPSKSD